MGEQMREEFLELFQSQDEKHFLAFGVLGGIFSEGIDLVGRRLIGAAIVGVGLPQMCLERDLIMDHFSHGHRGFDYSYMYPGFNKVLQGVGRVIRTENDEGVILLMDKRYGDFRYRKLFPTHWQSLEYISNSKQLTEKLDKFWG
ncbi:helicase C-terminal domain-containing protein [Alkalicella caledoniensis]|uniref:helicase C-terminal domain-containing protein n=1 Tax=Alkalicella caledoniensis TaxID=2731377 RepID=UPI0031B5D1AE